MARPEFCHEIAAHHVFHNHIWEMAAIDEVAPAPTVSEDGSMRPPASCTQCHRTSGMGAQGLFGCIILLTRLWGYEPSRPVHLCGNCYWQRTIVCQSLTTPEAEGG